MATMKEIDTNMPSIKEVVAGVTAKVASKAEINKGVTAVFQFNIGGDDPMSFFYSMEDGVPTFGEGTAENANTTFSISAADFRKMVDGTLKGTMAFMSGKLKITGDMSWALKVEAILFQ